MSLSRRERLVAPETRVTTPFRIVALPALAYLFRIGFHRYRRRWTKGIFKRPGRRLFDFAYHVLKLGGEAEMVYAGPSGDVPVRFPIRHIHFSHLYFLPPDTIFEVQIMALLERLMRGGDVYFDIGANWGMVALHAAALPGWTGPIHAFEPIAETFADLDNLVRRIGLDGRVTAHNLALSDRSGTATMAFANGFASGTATLRDVRGVERQEVRLARLDDLDIPPPAFMKLDVEGHEAAVLAGARRTIAEAKPMIVFETWYRPGMDEDWRAPFDVLSAAGYDFYRPVWLHDAGGKVDVWAGTQPPPGEPRILALDPMAAEDRVKMPEHIDIFACHPDRQDELRSRFCGPGA